MLHRAPIPFFPPQVSLGAIYYSRSLADWSLTTAASFIRQDRGLIVIEDTSASTHTMGNQTITTAIASATPYAFSFIANQEIGDRHLSLLIFDSTFVAGSVTLSVNLSTGAVISGPTLMGNFNTASVSVQRLPGRRLKITLIFQTSAVDTAWKIQIGPRTIGATSYTGDGVSCIRLAAFDLRLAA